MKFDIFSHLPKEAIHIREMVFMKEQGFNDEFDDIDDTAFHMVAWHDDKAVGTCRFFKGEEKDTYVLGRIAVVKDCRGENVGAKIIHEAEKAVNDMGGKKIILHAQKRAVPFYEKQGYSTFGEIEYEEYCPHIWMEKHI